MLPLLKQKVIEYSRKLEQLRDIRVLGMIIFLIIVLLMSWSGVKVIQSNYALQKQIATLDQENAVQQLKNNNLELQNEYLQTNQYLDTTARANFGLAAPGETELLVPANVALAHLEPIPALKAPLTKLNSQQSTGERNFQAWMDFLLHRSSS